MEHVAFLAQDNQVLRTLVSQTVIIVVMYLEAIMPSAELAAITCKPYSSRADIAPVIRLEVFIVGYVLKCLHFPLKIVEGLAFFPS